MGQPQKLPQVTDGSQSVTPLIDVFDVKGWDMDTIISFHKSTGDSDRLLYRGRILAIILLLLAGLVFIIPLYVGVIKDLSDLITQIVSGTVLLLLTAAIGMWVKTGKKKSRAIVAKGGSRVTIETSVIEGEIDASHSEIELKGSLVRQPKENEKK